MTRNQIIRAWKDEEFRSSLSEMELSLLPEHPAGLVQLSDNEMGNVGGQEITTNTTLLTLTATMDFWCPPLSLLRNCSPFTVSGPCN